MQTGSVALTGIPLAVTRRLLKDADNPDTVADWQDGDATAWDDLLDAESYTTLTTGGCHRGSADHHGCGGAYAAGGVRRGGPAVGQLADPEGRYGAGLSVASLTYSAAGQKLREEHGNGVVTTYLYEPETQRLTGIKTETVRPDTPPGARVLQDLRYEYDPVGNVLSVRNDAEETRFWRNPESGAGEHVRL
ncbi:Uncharacterised protein [Enterobacter cancerogenus]|uniref:Uncharacterized protein n=1 Tax=Enterobacter cancerogenus TaxID=69218 RepID=A0A484WSS8_9ENTR|nr:Uncharacterised protein [Enterobacter cancerogenus]